MDRPTRDYPFMNTAMSLRDMERLDEAKKNRDFAYNEAYKMFEWGQEPYTKGGYTAAEQHSLRCQHYDRLRDLFQQRTTCNYYIRRICGQEVSVFRDLCADPNVQAAAQATIRWYLAQAPQGFPVVPITVPVLLMISMHYLDTGGNYKQMGTMWEIPLIGTLIDEGVYAIKQLDNIKLPNTAAGWMTSVLGFQNMHGMPNVAASLDITPIYMQFKSPLFHCPEKQRSCVKVATVMDSSGKYLAFKVFKGSLTEPELLNQWDFYHRLKATEARIALPGVTVQAPLPYHPDHPPPPPRSGPRARPHAAGRGPRAAGRGPRAPRHDDDIPRLPPVQLPPLAGFVEKSSWPSNAANIKPTCSPTSTGIIVDGRYGSRMCSLLIAPSPTLTTYEQRLTRTRMFHDRLFGILSQYNHIKMRPMPAESSGHDLENAIEAMLCIMNLRLSALGNMEHACLSSCTVHRQMSEDEASALMDPTPYDRRPYTFTAPQTVSYVLGHYCREMLQPYTLANMKYLLKQLDWPELIVHGESAAHAAFGRELSRVYHFRRVGVLPPERMGMGSRPLTREIRERVVREQRQEREREGLVVDEPVDGEIADAYQEYEDEEEPDDEFL